MKDPAPEPVRAQTERLWPGWDEKRPEQFKKKPVYRRGWFLRSVLVTVVVVTLVSAVATIFFLRWRRDHLADLARQQRGLESFVHSEDFAIFARGADAQLLAMLNFVVAHPVDTRTLLPEVVAWENAHHALPWTLSIPSLPVSAAADAARVTDATRHLAHLLVERDLRFDRVRRANGRRLFLHLLEPQATLFVEAAPEKNFPRLYSDRRLQELALGAYAAHTHTDATIADVEESFVLYAMIGPALWRAIEADEAARRSPPPPR